MWLTVEVTRALVMAQSLQLVGFMQHKGAGGTITNARQASFLLSMSVAVLAEYVSYLLQLFVSEDLLYCPFGSVQGLNVQSMTYGVRIPVRVKPDNPACYFKHP